MEDIFWLIVYGTLGSVAVFFVTLLYFVLSEEVRESIKDEWRNS